MTSGRNRLLASPGTGGGAVVSVPIAQADNATVQEGLSVVIDVMANDTGDSIVLLSVGAATAGSAALGVGANAGKVVYTAAPAFNGTANFPYTIRNSVTLATSTASVFVVCTDTPVVVTTLEYPVATAGETFVDTDLELTTALATVVAGQHIIMRPGSYTIDRTFTRSGTAAAPIVIRAATPLATTVQGVSWGVKANWLIFHGLRFNSGTNILEAGGFDNIVRRCDFTKWDTQAIRPYNGHTPLGALGGRWTVDYCSFHDPLPWYEPPGVDPQPSRVCIRARSNGIANFPYGWKVRRCHFHDNIAKLGPGYFGQTDWMEWPGDGPSHPNLNNANWLVEYCLFEDHPGKDATIDLKCGGNIMRYCTVLNCPGGRLDSRVWWNNRFEGIWLENCGGLDLNSRGHVVNGVRMIGGAKLQMIAGSDPSNAVSGANPMFQCSENDKIIGANGGNIRVGYKYSSSDRPATNCRIEANTNCSIWTDDDTNYGTWATKSAECLETGTTWSATASEPIVTPIKMTTALCGNTAAWQEGGTNPFSFVDYTDQWTVLFLGDGGAAITEQAGGVLRIVAGEPATTARDNTKDVLLANKLGVKSGNAVLTFDFRDINGYSDNDLSNPSMLITFRYAGNNTAGHPTNPNNWTADKTTDGYAGKGTGVRLTIHPTGNDASAFGEIRSRLHKNDNGLGDPLIGSDAYSGPSPRRFFADLNTWYRIRATIATDLLTVQMWNMATGSPVEITPAVTGTLPAVSDLTGTFVTLFVMQGKGFEFRNMS